MKTTSIHSTFVCMLMACVFGITSSAHAAAPVLVQSASKEITKERKINRASFTTPNTAGNLIVVYHVLDNTDGVTTTDTAGNNYQTCGAKTVFNGGANMAQIDYAANIKAGTNTVQANYLTTTRKPGARFGRMFIHEFSGLDTSNPCLAATSAISTGTSINSGSVTATAKDQLVFGAITSSVGQPTVGSGFTSILSASMGLTQLKLSAASGAVSASATTPSGNNVAHVAVFKQADVVIPPTDGTITAKSCNQADVQSAVNSAKDGETVAVPAGTCTWNTAVSITNKAVSLKGAGSDVGGTKLVYGGKDHSMLKISAGTKTGKVSISDLAFSGGDVNFWDAMAIQFDGPDGWRNLRIHNNSFEDTINWTIRGPASVEGLIDHNVFKGKGFGMILSGRGDKDWTTPLQLGGPGFFFVEDNEFNWNADYKGTTTAPTLDMENGGRVVFRNNKVANGFMETHDFVRNGMPSAHAYEVYNNSFTRTSGFNQWKGLDISAGTGVIFGNTFTGDYSVTMGAINYKAFENKAKNNRYNEKFCDGTDPLDANILSNGWYCQYQIGTSTYKYDSVAKKATITASPLYVWNNTLAPRAGAEAKRVDIQCTGECKHVQIGRDIMNGTAKPGYTPYTYPHPLQAAK